jgi:rubrerythrin
MPNPLRFSAAEIFDLAIQTERNGRAFYEAAAAAATNEAVRKIMAGLGVAEREHEATFRRLREGASETPAESYPGEFEAYMDAFLRTRILKDEASMLELVPQMDDLAALDYAIAFEKDTILFMYEMRELLPADDQPRINVLIRQEQTHVRLLQGIKDRRQ